jgi:hypothetical protein
MLERTLSMLCKSFWMTKRVRFGIVYEIVYC